MVGFRGRIQHDEERRALAERMVGLSVRTRKMFGPAVGPVEPPRVVIAADENRRFRRCPKTDDVVQDSAGDVETRLTHRIFHVIPEEDIEVRVFAVRRLVDAVEVETQRAVGIRCHHHLVRSTFRIKRLEGIDLPAGHRVAVRRQVACRGGQESVFVFSGGCEAGEVERVHVLRVVNHAVSRLPPACPGFRPLDAVFDARGGGVPADERNRHRRV